MAVIIVNSSSQHVRDVEDHLELAWGLIANSYDGDWSSASTEWRDAAIRWRDRYHELLTRMFEEHDRYMQEVFGPF